VKPDAQLAVARASPEFFALRSFSDLIAFDFLMTVFSHNWLRTAARGGACSSEKGCSRLCTGTADCSARLREVFAHDLDRLQSCSPRAAVLHFS